MNSATLAVDQLFSKRAGEDILPLLHDLGQLSAEYGDRDVREAMAVLLHTFYSRARFQPGENLTEPQAAA